MRQSEMARKLGEAADVLCDNNDMIEQLNARLKELNTALEGWQGLARDQNLTLHDYRRRLEQSIADVERWQNYAASFWIIADPEKRGGVLHTLNEIHHYTEAGETTDGPAPEL